jgi:putative MATE family efflux protein
MAKIMAGSDAAVTMPKSDSSTGAIRRLVVRLAWPAIVENMLQSVFGVVLLLLIARLGPAAVAGFGAANGLTMVAMSAFFSLSMGATVLVAHATGARTPGAAILAAKQSLVLGVIVGLAMTAAGVIFAPQLVTAMGAGPNVVREGAAFLRTFSLGGVFIVLTFIAGGVLRGTGDARTPMLVTLATLALGLLLAYPLTFGGLGLPALGVAGAGLAGTITRGLGCVVLLFLMGRPSGPIPLTGRAGWRPSREPLRQLVAIGLPSMVEALFRSGGMLLFTVIVFQLGTAVAAAQQIVQQAAFLSMMPGFGFAMSATALVGQSLGARDPVRADRATWFATRACMTWMGAMGVVFFLGGEWIMTLFSDDPAIIAQGAAALRIVALAQPGQALGIVLAGSLRGAGDTRYPMVTTGLAMWLVRLPVAWLLGIVLGFGLVGIYLGWVFDSIVLGLLTLWRYRSGGWKTNRLVSPGLDADHRDGEDTRAVGGRNRVGAAK